MSERPHRAFRLTLKLDGDTRDDIVRALEQLATDVSRREVTVGTYGASTHGAIYELLVDENQTHDLYFEQLHEYLRSLKDPA